ncbi:MAG: SUMF1/EgtB/PvdO family nonheme iron enzyme, partial [Treponema sp.]|nr:SUMF1/EgtB/PvdO family nonheme iron enzyme [Treponema sp.]
MKKLAVFIIFVFFTSCLWGQQKFALVIGNGSYTGISALRNPVNDANDVAAALQELGFTVEKVLNGDFEQMENAVINLKRRLGGSRNSYGFFFYAGHGAQANGENYLIPVEASTIQNETHLRLRAVSLQFIMDSLNEAGNELNMIVLDACRDNPFGWNRSGRRGLSVVSYAPAGSIVMYATSANSVAEDGSGRNGLFTTQLLNNLKAPGLSVFEIFDKTMGDVIRVSNGRQHPELSLRFPGAASAYLGLRSSPSSAPAPSPSIVPQSLPSNMLRVEGGTFQMGSARGGGNDERPVRDVTVTSFLMSKYQVTQKEWLEVMERTIEQQRIAAGSDLLYGRGDNYPVYYVSWLEAVEYCNRLSIKEGLTPVYSVAGSNVTCDWTADGYRLPTEAEWEYAAKGGNKDTLLFEYSGSNNAEAVAWYASNSGGGVKPVGTKAPNSLGFYDMSGNVFEWCWDWYGPYPGGAQLDPTGAPSGSHRVIRGGAWYDFSSFLRSASRD